MRGAGTAAAVAAIGLMAPPAAACSPILGAFKDIMPRTALAVRARARFHFTETGDERIVGTASLDVRECLYRVKAVRRCPRRLDIRIDETRDGINCPPEIIEAVYGRPKLRFFSLWRSDTLGWQIELARSQFEVP